jgi:hypothetical protein
MFSAVSGIEWMPPPDGIRELSNRQPIVARIMLSTPPASVKLASPARIARVSAAENNVIQSAPIRSNPGQHSAEPIAMLASSGM